MELLSIDSNIDAVIEQVTQVRPKVWRAVESAMNTDYWGRRGLEVAESTLVALSTDEERDAVGRLLDSFRKKSIASPVGFEWRMGGIQPEAKPFAFGELAGAFSPLFRDTAMEIILDWVEEAKELDERDQLSDGEVKTNEEIAEGIFWILFSSDRTWDKEIAADSLLKSKNPTGLAEYARQLSDRNSVTKERMEEWLQMVGHAWVRLIEAELRPRMVAKINTALRG